MTKAKLIDVFKNEKPVIGLIHFRGKHSSDRIDTALEEIKAYESVGLNGVLLQDYYATEKDIKRTLENVKGMNLEIPIGVSIIRENNFKVAYNMAKNYDLPFIHIDFISGRYIPTTEHGAPIKFDAEGYDHRRFDDNYSKIFVMGGVHPRNLTPTQESVLETQLKIAGNRADAIVVSSEDRGRPIGIDKIAKYGSYSNMKPIIAIGVTDENMKSVLNLSNGVIMGSYLRQDKNLNNPLDYDRIEKVLTTRDNLLK